jgi:PTH1 family peptidyl-tRNA hydrolase
VAEIETKEIVFVGLGNPGKKYEMTRHNMGFLVIESFAHLHGIPLKEDTKLRAKVGKGIVGGWTVHLVMPLTYMNVSGEAVRKYINYYKLTTEQVVVVTDDVAIPFGELRLREQGSPGGHNGLKSVQQHLGSNRYTRLRVGIGRQLHPSQELSDFVLDPFSKNEVEQLPALMNRGVKALELLMTESLTNAMNVVNSKLKPEEEKQNG